MNYHPAAGPAPTRQVPGLTVRRDRCWRDSCDQPASTAVGLCRTHAAELRDPGRTR